MKRRILKIGCFLICFAWLGLFGWGCRFVVAANVPTTPRITRFLLLGCDQSTRLTDSILLVTVNETAKSTTILQIPRDTYAEYTQKDYKKLNGAMSSLGERGIKQFISDALGVPIDFFVVLKLQFFDDLVNAIGGVDVDIPQDMHYSDPSQNLEIHLSKGRAHLNGREAEQFVRYRSGYVNADLGRLDAQKIFLKAFAKQCQTLSIPALLRITFIALTGVQTDIGIAYAIRVVGVLRACNTEQIPMATLPGQAVRGKSGAWYYAINREGACRAVNEYLLPSHPILPQNFDIAGVFHREQDASFSRIYQAQEKELPLLMK